MTIEATSFITSDAEVDYLSLLSDLTDAERLWLDRENARSADEQARSAAREARQAAEGGLLSSLVPSSETVDGPQWHCRRVTPIVLVNRADPQQYFLSGCDAYQCEWCGPGKARRFSRGVAWQLAQHDRSRFITLTQAPEDWQKRRQAMRDLARWCRAKGYKVEWAWTTEVGSKTGMVHIHATAWGDFIPQKALSDRWGRRVDIRLVRDQVDAVTGYVAKGAGQVTRYLTKEGAAEYTAWRDLNGGRPLHTSRGFFEGRGIRGALSALAAERRAETGADWCTAPASMQAEYMALGALPKEKRAERVAEMWAGWGELSITS